MEEIKNSPVKEDLEFFKREWKIEKTGWIIMFFLVSLAGLGLMGEGPISRSTVGAYPEKMQIHYSYFMRILTQDKISIELAKAAEKPSVWISRDYLKDIEIENILPEPESQVIEADKVIYFFKSGRQGQNIEVTFSIKPEKFGIYHARIGTGTDVEEFKQFVYL
jgi:hypothetical protein